MFVPLLQTDLVWEDDHIRLEKRAPCYPEAISKVRRTKGGVKGAEAHCPDVKEVEKTFWIIRSDDWVINKKTKHIIMIEFKRASDIIEAYYSDMKSIV